MVAPLLLPLTLGGPGAPARAVLCLSWLDSEADRAACVPSLTPAEAAVWAGYRHPRRKDSYLAGRWTAKAALARWARSAGPRDFSVGTGAFTQPVVTGPVPNLQVTLSHSGPLAAAVAFPETHPMGIDVERVSRDLAQTLEDQFSPGERTLWEAAGWSGDQALTLLWTAKEALGKALRTGLTTPLAAYSLSGSEFSPGAAVSRFTNFTQYRVLSFLAGDWACSVCHPDNAPLDLHPDLVRSWLAPLR